MERKRLSPAHVAVLAVFGLLLALALVGPIVWGDRAEAVDLEALGEGASWAHPFGTDDLGRDMFARVLVATRLSLVLALLTAGLGCGLGLLLGLLPTMLGSHLGKLAGSAIGLLLALPGLLLALLVATIVGVGATGAVVGLAVAIAPAFARLTQTLAAQVADSEYVAAARMTGISLPRLMARHVLPNIAPALVLQAAMTIGGALLALSALSFLGLGVQEPQYDWGALLNAGLDRIYVTPAAALGPGIAIIIAGIAFNVTGDAFAGALAGETIRPARRSGRGRSRSAAASSAVPANGPSTAGSDAVLQVDGLSVAFEGDGGTLTPVRDVSFSVGAGERVGIVGESGSGKSLTALAIADLIEPPGTVQAKRLALHGRDLRELPERERRRLLVTSLAMVFQDPLSSLNPVLRIERQVGEAAEVHLGATRRQARVRAVEQLRELRIPGAARRMGQHPHELSGGMRQRVTIAMGLTTRPSLIVADEPTTALDVTVQRQVLRVLRRVNAEHGTAVVLISHDISVISAFCERVLVMYAGRVVEELAADRMHADAAHPYTRALLAATPALDADLDRPLATIPGRQPALDAVPDGCPFAPRCVHASDRCRERLPLLETLGEGRRVACWHPQGTALPVPEQEMKR
ncbi:dipeptide/oligopeptide/nickel ABC transporter permease/ATP-binding protein [Streptosporangium fragile]|uniref:Dipeptide/oligopeptide/nickel ABC transporter permease/ATP-binding protein n=1 Tax=Streptosporangium fragile TaxID=46186 RepID=A0ABN3WBT4_9ACTN